MKVMAVCAHGVMCALCNQNLYELPATPEERAVLVAATEWFEANRPYSWSIERCANQVPNGNIMTAAECDLMLAVARMLKARGGA